jgi:hypothetical protein
MGIPKIVGGGVAAEDKSVTECGISMWAGIVAYVPRGSLVVMYGCIVSLHELVYADPIRLEACKAGSKAFELRPSVSLKKVMSMSVQFGEIGVLRLAISWLAERFAAVALVRSQVSTSCDNAPPVVCMRMKIGIHQYQQKIGMNESHEWVSKIIQLHLLTRSGVNLHT